jgi:hypothetical protein
MKFIFVSFCLLILIGCTSRYIPVEGGDVSVQDEFGIVKRDDLILIIQNKYWNIEPKKVNDFFETFHISIQNRTDEVIEVREADMFLLDEDGNQYDSIPVKNVEHLILPDELRFEHFTELNEEQPQIIEDWQEAKQNLMRNSFHFGRILPNAKRSGFVYFSKLSSANQKCKIVFQDITIPFERNDKKKK